MKNAIGIDLGTTYSCVGIYKGGKTEIISNNYGEYTMPSVVSFLENGTILNGRSAKNSQIRNYKNTIFNSKRLIGRKYKDKEVQYEIKNSPFKIIEEEDIKCPLIVIENNNNKNEFYYPQEISSILLKQLKKTAEEYLNQEVKDAVITVPAYFNELQRQCTRDAGKLAGLNVLRIINEPTAAAIAYGLQNNTLVNKYILIFDLGGGTFDVSVLTINEDGIIIVKSTCGNSHLGGEDFDNRLMVECIKKFKTNTGIDISNNKKAKIRLKLACEKAKIELSSLNETTIDIDNIANGEDLNINITRSDFENYCNDLFLECIPYVKQAIKDAKINKNDINDIVLVGGSSHIPKIKELVKNFFNRSELLSAININPNEAVAYGASYLANILINETIKEENIVLLDIVGISIGIEINDKKMEIIIPKDTNIPNSKKKTFQTNYDNQKCMNISIYQGEDVDDINNNYFIKEILINDIEEAPAGEMKFDITFSIDVSSCLTIEIKDLKKQTIKIYSLVDEYSKNYEIKILKILGEKKKKDFIYVNDKDYREDLINLCKIEIEKKNQIAQEIYYSIQKNNYPISEKDYLIYINNILEPYENNEY
jgi:L1 cell adhesion molecule like protein